MTEGEFENVYDEGMEEGDYVEGDGYEEDDSEVDPLMI